MFGSFFRINNDFDKVEKYKIANNISNIKEYKFVKDQILKNYYYAMGIKVKNYALNSIKSSLLLSIFSEYYFGNSGVFKDFLGNSFYYLTEDFDDFSHIIIAGEKSDSKFNKKTFDKIIKTIENESMSKEEFDNIKNKILNDLKNNARRLNKLLTFGYLNDTKNISDWARNEDLSYFEYKTFFEDIKRFEFLGLYDVLME